MAGIPVLSAVSAPSALAVDLGEEVGLTVIGFNRGDRFNIYAGAHRVYPDLPSHAPAGEPPPAANATHRTTTR